MAIDEVFGPLILCVERPRPGADSSEAIRSLLLHSHVSALRYDCGDTKSRLMSVRVTT